MENNYVKKPSRNISITLLHVIGMLMILACHAFQAEKIYFISEIMIAGVSLFLFVSGYLSGLKEIKEPGNWLLRKAQRILIPYYLFILVVFGMYSIFNFAEVSLFQWIFCFFDLQGLNYTIWRFDLYGAVAGCGHLWFITTIAFCYLLTPLIQKIRNVELTVIKKTVIIVGLLLVQLGLLFAGIQLSYIITYFLGYMVALKPVRTDVKWYSLVTILMVAVTAIRLVCRRFLDGTLFYNSYVALVSAAVIGVWIFYTVFFVGARFPKLLEVLDCKPIHAVEKISYYIYITHYIFFRGPFAVNGYVNNKIVEYLLIIAFSVASAIVLWFVVEECIFKMIEKIKRKKHENSSCCS